MRLIQWILDAFHELRSMLTVVLVLLLIRLYGSEVTYEQAKDGKLDSQKFRYRELGDDAPLPDLLDISSECLKASTDRRNIVTDKCKTLITVSSLLLGIMGFLLPKALTFHDMWMQIAAPVVIALLFITIILLLSYFDVRGESQVSLDDEFSHMSSDDVKRDLINSRIQCQIEVDNRTDYLIEVYKTARFYLLSAVVLITILVTGSLFKVPPPDDSERIVVELRGTSHVLSRLKSALTEMEEVGDQETLVVEDDNGVDASH